MKTVSFNSKRRMLEKLAERDDIDSIYIVCKDADGNVSLTYEGDYEEMIALAEMMKWHALHALDAEYAEDYDDC